jgi:hypothetical protein
MITDEELIRNIHQAGAKTEFEALLLDAFTALVDERAALEAEAEQQEEADAARIEELESQLAELQAVHEDTLSDVEYLKQQLAEAT